MGRKEKSYEVRTNEVDREIKLGGAPGSWWKDIFKTFDRAVPFIAIPALMGFFTIILYWGLFY